MGRKDVDRFARFFVMPQTGHGLSGTNYATSGDGKTLTVAPVPNGWDRLALLFDWVERGVAPGMSITVTAGEKSLPRARIPRIRSTRAGRRVQRRRTSAVNDLSAGLMPRIRTAR